MKYLTNCLLENLYEQTEQNIYKAISEWQQLPAEFFTAQPGSDKWSAAQCLEHLNSYGRYYLPAMEKAIAKSANTHAAAHFKSGWLGHYFYNLMLTNGNGKVKKKLSAPKAHRPTVLLNAAQVLSEFISQQEILMQLITQSHAIDLNKAMVPVSIAPFIKLKLGDTLLFYIAHIDRHIAQAERALLVAGYIPPVARSVMG